MDWLELYGSAELDFPLEVEVGSRFEGGANYPDAVVTASDLLYPRRMLIQRLEINAENIGGERKERIRIYRVAVETEDGDLVEIRRHAVPCGDSANVDTSKCAGCGGAIPNGQHVVIDAMAYHKRCVEDGDDPEADSGSGGRCLPGDAVGGLQGYGVEGEEEEGDGPASEAAPTTVTKTRSDDGISVSHLVTVTKVDDDRDIVTLWAREFDGLSGTVQGRWSTGLFHGELPKQSDADYIDQKFFRGAGVVTASDLRVWNRLYKEAVRGLRQPPR